MTFFFSLNAKIFVSGLHISCSVSSLTQVRSIHLPFQNMLVAIQLFVYWDKNRCFNFFIELAFHKAKSEDGKDSNSQIDEGLSIMITILVCKDYKSTDKVCCIQYA